MSQVERTVRLSQTITPFGVGAIYDVLGESLVACDISYWKGRGRQLDAQRLADYLKVDELRRAPAKASFFSNKAEGALPYFRFPSWLFCSSCRRMYFWRPEMEKEGEPPTCEHCENRKLTPMRFIMICEHGHMMDVPWSRWAHLDAKNPHQKQCRSKKLRFNALSDVGGGLRSLEVQCRDCGARENLSGITRNDRMKGIPGIRCFGKQPWQSTKKSEECEQIPQVVQRGASNVHYPSIRSAIDIPPFSRYDIFSDLAREVADHENFNLLTSGSPESVKQHVASTIADEVGCTPEQVLQIAEQEVAEREGRPMGHENDDDLEVSEWNAFITPDAEQSERDRFVTDHVDLLPNGTEEDPLLALDRLIDRVVITRKLREVRALGGFYRYRPGGQSEDSEAKLVRPDCGNERDWLPAIEVFGEGVFFSLDEERLQAWESDPDVRSRVQKLEMRRQDSVYGAILPEATPRFVLLHTLAHLLIRQLSFECGYASSSLRERIYCRSAGEEDTMAGLLVYTAAGDVEGTLGGLARQGEPPRLARTFLSSLQRGSWCSTDPICAESTGQGVDGMNLGACHACGLLSETSCVHMNLLLDRVLLIGSDQINGFFEEVLTHALEHSLS